MFAQIPCNHIRWSLNNDLAGRGATRWQTNAAAAPASEPSHDRRSFTDELLGLPGSANEKLLGTTVSQLDLSDPPVNKVHVYGLDLKGRYIAHALAGSEKIPAIGFLMHDSFQYSLVRGDRLKFTLKRNGHYTTRDVVTAEYIGERNPRWLPNNELISNLILTVPAGHVIRALEPIAHRLDHRSSICLLQDGLGIAEHIIETYFPDELTRPIFILGHLSTSVGHLPEHEGLIGHTHFAVEELKRRQLLLTILPPYAHGKPAKTPPKHWPPKEKVARYKHLISLVKATPDLCAVSSKFEDFFYYKLPTVAFRAIADPVVTLLDITYDRIHEHAFAKRLVENCVSEMCDVVSRFPQFKEDRRFSKFNLAVLLREEVFKRIREQKTANSKMRADVSRGNTSDIDYLTGFFVEKGHEMGASVAALETLMLGVKAKQSISRQKPDTAIPFEQYCQREPREKEEPRAEVRRVVCEKKPKPREKEELRAEVRRVIYEEKPKPREKEEPRAEVRRVICEENPKPREKEELRAEVRRVACEGTPGLPIKVKRLLYAKKVPRRVGVRVTRQPQRGRVVRRLVCYAKPKLPLDEKDAEKGQSALGEARPSSRIRAEARRVLSEPKLPLEKKTRKRGDSAKRTANPSQRIRDCNNAKPVYTLTALIAGCKKFFW